MAFEKGLKQKGCGRPKGSKNKKTIIKQDLERISIAKEAGFNNLTIEDVIGVKQIEDATRIMFKKTFLSHKIEKEERKKYQFDEKMAAMFFHKWFGNKQSVEVKTEDTTLQPPKIELVSVDPTDDYDIDKDPEAVKY